MRRVLVAVAVAAVASAVLTASVCHRVGRPIPRAVVPIDQASCSVLFSPDGGCTEAVVDVLRAATNSVLVQAYSFTSPSISDALVEAKARGVDVRVVLDANESVSDYSVASKLSSGGVAVLADKAHAIAHNKVMIVDGAVVVTGSFNFTRQAEQRNAENLLIIRSQEMAATYSENWKAHAAHSLKYSTYARRVKASGKDRDRR